MESTNFNSEEESKQEKVSSFSETWDEGSFSHSVNTLLRTVSELPDGADIIEVLKILINLHPEYGKDNNKKKPTSEKSALGAFQVLYDFVKKNQRLLDLPRYSSKEWAEEALSIFQIPPKPPLINGRLFLIAVLLSANEQVKKHLKNDSEWTELCTELIDRIGEELLKESIAYLSLLTEKGRHLHDSLNKSLTEDPDNILKSSIIDTKNLTDGPAKEDSLSRKALANYLAKRLRHIYDRDMGKKKLGSFFMHIDGAWGSGKSTLLGFLNEELKLPLPEDPEPKRKKLSNGKWIIVNFNAWENQRLDPPWWFLMKTLHSEAIKSLKSGANGQEKPENSKKDKKIVRRLIWSENLWRIKSGNNYFLLAGITLILFIVSLRFEIFNKEEFNDLPIIQLLTFIGFLWSLVKAFGSGLVTGTAKAAQKFIDENGNDPLQEIAEHFKHQIEIIEYPVAIFIDDLDRCNTEYGITLLEGLQTIFKKAGVVYVIAADRKWLSTMYEQQYVNFAPIIEKPSKPFGLVFLDKIFQLIVELPDISSVQKKIYWENLLNIKVASEAKSMNIERKDVQNKIQEASSNANKMEIAKEPMSSLQTQQMAREEVLGALSIQEEEQILEHKLQHFVVLIEPNPRAMKRLINDISTARAISFLYNQEVDEDQLILWTILKLQHPLIAQYFWNYPQKLDQVIAYIDLEKEFTGNSDFDHILANPKEKMLFHHIIGDKNISLTKEFILKLKFQDPI